MTKTTNPDTTPATSNSRPDVDEFRRLVALDVNEPFAAGTRQYRTLRTQTARWRTELAALLNRTNDSLAASRDKLARRKLEFLSNPDGKSLYLDERRRYLQWREQALARKIRIEARLQHVKGLDQ